ncbi:MAG: PDZ domain-containing protein [Rudaea sp.]|nr:PDZ domain-containing protein [Rudaea sp.]
MSSRIIPLFCLLTITAASVRAADPQPSGTVASAETEQRLRQDVQLMLSRLAASGALGQHPDQLDMRLNEPARRVANLGILVDSTSAERARDGLRVLGATPGSTAERLGLQPGDVIVAVNNISLRDLGADADGRALAAATLKSSVDNLVDASPLRLQVVRGSQTLELSAPLQIVYLPALRMELGVAAMAATDTAKTAPTLAAGGGCGRISTFDVASRSDHQYHARILLLDGVTPGPSGGEVYRVAAGEHRLLVAENIPTRQMGFSEIASLRRNTSKELIVDVKAGTTAMVAAQLHLDKAGDLAHGGYWDPVVWRESPEACP